jgi:hypothetical protein
MTACLTAQLSRFAEALGEQRPREGFFDFTVSRENHGAPFRIKPRTRMLLK